MRVPELREQDLSRVVQALREISAGSTNAMGTVTLTASATSTVVTNALCSTSSMIVLVPTTNNAATAIVWQSAVANGSFTLGHDSTAAVDRTFKYEVRRGPI
jgi:hypothetical protein